MFVDASAMVAILTDEPDAVALADLLDAANAPITSPIAVFESVLAVCRKRRASVEKAAMVVRKFLQDAGVRVIPITPEQADLALAAYELYGKGMGHRAQLNMGDCFAYASAQSAGAAILCKVDDFRRTDIPIAE
jgi:ribonuclease VapC